MEVGGWLREIIGWLSNTGWEGLVGYATLDGGMPDTGVGSYHKRNTMFIIPPFCNRDTHGQRWDLQVSGVSHAACSCTVVGDHWLVCNSCTTSPKTGFFRPRKLPQFSCPQIEMSLDLPVVSCTSSGPASPMAPALEAVRCRETSLMMTD